MDDIADVSSYLIATRGTAPLCTQGMSLQRPRRWAWSAPGQVPPWQGFGTPTKTNQARPKSQHRIFLLVTSWYAVATARVTRSASRF